MFQCRIYRRLLLNRARKLFHYRFDSMPGNIHSIGCGYDRPRCVLCIRFNTQGKNRFIHLVLPQKEPGKSRCIIQTANQNAGTITRDSLSEDITAAFKPKLLEAIPKEYSSPTREHPDFADIDEPEDLAVAALLGGWDDNNDYDRKILEHLRARVRRLGRPRHCRGPVSVRTRTSGEPICRCGSPEMVRLSQYDVFQ